MTAKMKRRAFITLLGGAAAWPLAARAQQLQRVQRIGILMGVADDAETKGWLVTFNQRLEQLGWQAGRNLQIDERWTGGIPSEPGASPANFWRCTRTRFSPSAQLGNFAGRLRGSRNKLSEAVISALLRDF